MWLTCASRRFLAVGLRVLADARFTAFAFSRNTINVTTNSHGALCQVEIGTSYYAKRLRANHVKFLARSLYPLEFRHRDCQRQWARWLHGPPLAEIYVARDLHRPTRKTGSPGKRRHRG